MSNFVTFQTQLVSIMEILAKAAVAEINRRVDAGCAVFRVEMSQSQREIEALKRKLQMLERKLMKAQERKTVDSLAMGEERSPPAESDVGQDWSFSLWRDGAPTPVEKSSGMEEARPESLLIKQERLEEDVCYSEPQPTPAGEEQVTEPTPAGHPEEQVAQSTPVEEEKKQETGPTPAGDPEELREQHRCGHSDEELSGLEFVVKAEQEEEHVAQRLSQTGCEHSAGRLNNLGSEYVMYERDSQLWTSFTQGDSDIETADPVCSNATEQYSQSLSVHSELQHTPATVEGSGNTVSSIGKPVDMVDGVFVKEEASGQCLYSEKNRSEMSETYQIEFIQNPLSMRDNLTQDLWQPLQQPLDWQTGMTERITDSNSFGTKKTRNPWRAGVGEKPYSCAQCEKSFYRFIDLERHKRIHTGEKPFSCAQCGKCFSLRGNLITHERVHSGNKPYGCVQCGKRFAQGSNLRAHQRIHTGERPYHCAQCGKSFTQLSALKTHQKVHSRNELLQFGMSCS